MLRTRKVKSRGKKHHRVNKTRQRRSKHTKRVHLGVQIKNCVKPCMQLQNGSRRKRNCLKKHCKSVIHKIVHMSNGKKSRKNKRKMKGGYGKGACSLIGAPWNANDMTSNYYSLNKYGIGPGGKNIYPGNISPSPQHGGSGGLWQQLVLNPYRGAIGTLGGLYDVHAGKGLSPSAYPHIQNQLTPQTYDIPDVIRN